ncbi:MAG: peptide ABC transporter substrate-binding protein [Candidatus Magasanikbacteria bacterium]|nr:peptide ABC transporter substrate-binding protein [Candidatus Magasanikbacteria bacterium]MBT4220732.1 peptide ABC transporter substrate-binding protein [Candidatus Magasanikbacteria bacterium]MBT4350077.1 peptide ABC transporter substrate-binding protein [Candidatus Magasanikbacteria bacterium]MBT4541480.1 peptide ABC transporter substrate-binding protein [Candidatus Magasanikbacteria bacterium]MBT6253008.1 peptide ABC transporter substrate-binding protein [Candidatus Magasanikbacteria bact
MKKYIFSSSKRFSSHKDVSLVRRVHGKRFPSWKQFRHIHKILSSREMLFFRMSVFVFFVAIVWVGLVSASTYRVRVPAIGGKYIEAVVGSPQLVNPIFASVNDVDLDLTRLVYAGLMRHDDAQTLHTDLAKSYTISEDQLTYTFELRDDISWHDGESLTARDVVFTIETIQNPEVNSPLIVSFQGVLVEAIDEKTVRFTLEEPFTPFLSSLVFGVLPEHVWGSVSAERMRLAGANLRPVGAGPFQFARFVKDETGFIYKYELARYEGYHHAPSFIKELVFRFYEGEDAYFRAIQDFREQKVDGLHFVPFDMRDRVERKHIVLHTLQLPQYTALFFNEDHAPVLEEVEVRTALALSIDKERILRDVLRDEGEAINGPILPNYPGFDPNQKKLEYSVSKANDLLDTTWTRVSVEDYREKNKAALLLEWEEEQQAILETKVQADAAIQEALDENAEDEEAEAVDDAVDSSEESVEEGLSIEALRTQKEEDIDLLLDQEIDEGQTFYRQDEDENLLTIDLVTARTPEYERAIDLIVASWQEIGVRVRTTFIDPKDISRTTLRDRTYDVLLYGAIIGSDPDPYPFWHSSQIDFPGLNLARYVNRTADGFLEDAREATDPVEIADFYRQFQDLLFEDRPATFLYTPTYTYATSDIVRGITVSRIFVPADRFAGITGWYIKTDGKWKFRK